MSEKEFSSDGNTPHVPQDQAQEAEPLPPGNNLEAEGQGEHHPVEAELLPPENVAEAEGQEVEYNQVEAELVPENVAEAGGQEVEHHPVVAELLPENDAHAKEEKPDCLSIDYILSRCRDFDVEAGQEAERHRVEAKLSSFRKKESREARQNLKCHPIEAELWPHRNEDSEEVERHELHGSETECKDSDPGSPLEGAVGGEVDCNCGGVHFSPCERKRIQSGKEDIFRKFFSTEYDQANAPILGRHRHSAQKQRPRQRHVSEDSKLSDQNPLGCLQDAGTSGGAVLNQAGAIIGKYIPKEEIPEYTRFGTEFGQSLPVVPTTEGSERSLSSISTARIGDLYGGTFSVISDLSYDSEEFGQRIAFPSFSRPSTASDNPENSSPPDSNPPDDKEKLPMTADSENIAHENIIRQRRSDIVSKPEQTRSKSALARLSACAGDSQDSGLRQRKSSKDRSVCSEPLPERKISEDSFANFEPMNSKDGVNCPEHCHLLESDSSAPEPVINIAVDRLEENLGSLQISDYLVTDRQNVLQQDPETN